MRIPILIGIEKEINDKLLLEYDSGEVKYFLNEELLRILKETKAYEFTMSDVNQVELKNGLLTFPSVRIEVDYGDYTENVIYDLDPDFTYFQSRNLSVTFGEVFRNLRKQFNLSQEEVAARYGTDKHFISKFEQNKINVELLTLRRLFYLSFKIRINPQYLIKTSITPGVTFGFQDQTHSILIKQAGSYAATFGETHKPRSYEKKMSGLAEVGYVTAEEPQIVWDPVPVKSSWANVSKPEKKFFA
jgi:transcriptional regulator with XRE-family HTH domain